MAKKRTNSTVPIAGVVGANLTKTHRPLTQKDVNTELLALLVERELHDDEKPLSRTLVDLGFPPRVAVSSVVQFGRWLDDPESVDETEEIPGVEWEELEWVKTRKKGGNK